MGQNWDITIIASVFATVIVWHDYFNRKLVEKVTSEMEKFLTRLSNVLNAHLEDVSLRLSDLTEVAKEGVKNGVQKKE